MLGFLQAKAQAVVLTAAGVLLTLQVLAPTLVDIVLAILVFALVWVALRLR